MKTLALILNVICFSALFLTYTAGDRAERPAGLHDA